MRKHFDVSLSLKQIEFICKTHKKYIIDDIESSQRAFVKMEKKITHMKN